ncbi:YicC/YloC family endoribonuclease [Sediminispirochaeta smaragdinae]|jgi:uncharacterized protein (TIGR00255 family)|uniref:YicC domain protein n=1 Tax=Sediminispirochaeta smaragdinae (strain DSM 11293 / JCM 15392 / SEBR 4228) TaxID=573413 RepID=E1R769_SEDSS|nr:YicC/YloC family endoribonuclease [Sediminispirochaeta smaragdinae]ADK81396.1 YicC domain protein [Sediminispirochaeta smaragdinae DSM 11293]
MKSMTGYGFSEFSNDALQLSVELKSWNNRYLDISVNLPPFLSPLESDFRDRIKARAERGKIEFSVRLKELQEEIEVIPDLKVAESYMGALRTLADTLGESSSSLFPLLLNMDGVLKSVKNRDIERYRRVIIPLLDEILESFEHSRASEGTATKAHILSNLERVKKGLTIVRSGAAALEKKLYDALLERFKQLTDGTFDENRILSEVAVLLMKYGVAEEINRLDTHIAHFEAIAGQQGAVGKKLDFLCQEMNREVNTIGSKNTIAEIGHAVVEMKEAIENIREQLRNVE